MKVHSLVLDHFHHLAGLSELSNPPVLSYIGNPEILKLSLLAIFSSVKCPTSLLLKAHDLAKEISADGQAVISGFQSPAEKEMFTVLLRGHNPIVICPARGLDGMRIPQVWREPIRTGRLLVISPFSTVIKRPTASMAVQRNLFVASLAHEVLIIHAELGSKIQQLCDELQTLGKPVEFLENLS